MQQSGSDEPVVVELTPEETHPLRLAVLRFDTVTKNVVFPEDTWPGAFHLGVRLSDEPAGYPAITTGNLASNCAAWRHLAASRAVGSVVSC